MINFRINDCNSQNVIKEKKWIAAALYINISNKDEIL